MVQVATSAEYLFTPFAPTWYGYGYHVMKSGPFARSPPACSGRFLRYPTHFRHLHCSPRTFADSLPGGPTQHERWATVQFVPPAQTLQPPWSPEGPPKPLTRLWIIHLGRYLSPRCPWFDSLGLSSWLGSSMQASDMAMKWESVRWPDGAT